MNQQYHTGVLFKPSSFRLTGCYFIALEPLPALKKFSAALGWLAPRY
jgi:hypothetical protein